MTKNFCKALLFCSMAVVASCSKDIETEPQGNVTDELKEMKVETQVSLMADTRALVTGTTLANGDHIGVFVLKNSDNGNYDSKSYYNVDYSYNGSVWSTASGVLLSSTVGKVAAYYPRTNGYNTYSAIPVETASKKDWMWGTAAATVSNASPTAAITLHHALSAVRVNIVRGSYTGTGTVTALSVTSNILGTGASMNALTGTLSSKTGGGSALTWTGSATLESGVSPAPSVYDRTAVPMDTGTKNVSFSVTMDGDTYSASSNFGATTPTPGNIYSFTLTVNGTEMTVSSVTVTAWAAPTVIDAGGELSL